MKLFVAILVVTAAGCFVRPNDSYTCSGNQDCPPGIDCLDHVCGGGGPGAGSSGALSGSSEGASRASSHGSQSSSRAGTSSRAGGSSSSSGSTSTMEYPALIPCQPLPGCADGGCAFATDLAANDHAACVVLQDGTVQCWGENSAGDLGRGDDVSGDQATPDFMIDADGGRLHGASQVVRGPNFSCVIFDDGSMGCAGQDALNAWGPLKADAGRNSFQDFAYVRQLDTHDVITASGANVFMCIASTSATTCHGAEDEGALGMSLPAPVADLGSAPASFEGHWTLALLPDGSVVAWGGDNYGQFGKTVPSQNGSIFSATPVTIELPASAMSIAAGDDYGCAVLRDGRVMCWGTEGSRLGSDDGEVFGENGFQRGPAFVKNADGTDFGGAESVSARYEHTCAIRHDDGSLWCWGSNDYGQLGVHAPLFGSTSPVRNGDMGSWRKVVVIPYTTCALNTCGQVYCWGRNMNRILGNGFNDGEDGTDVPVRLRLMDP